MTKSAYISCTRANLFFYSEDTQLEKKYKYRNNGLNGLFYTLACSIAATALGRKCVVFLINKSPIIMLYGLCVIIIGVLTNTALIVNVMRPCSLVTTDPTHKDESP